MIPSFKDSRKNVAEKLLKNINEKIIAKKSVFIPRVKITCSDITKCLEYDDDDLKYLLSQSLNSEIANEFLGVFRILTSCYEKCQCRVSLKYDIRDMKSFYENSSIEIMSDCVLSRLPRLPELLNALEPYHSLNPHDLPHLPQLEQVPEI